MKPSLKNFDSSRLLIHNGTVLPFGKSGGVLEKHSILIEGDKIIKIAPAKSFRGSLDKISAEGKVILPGFINAHMHFYSTFARGFSRARSSKSFTEVLKHLWWPLDRALTLEDCYSSALVALVEAIKSGTTTILDHHSSPGVVKGSLNALARAVKYAGLRAALCYEVSDRDGGRVAEDALQENVDFIRQCQRKNDPQLRALFGLHASFTLSDRTLKRAVDLGSREGAGFHIHVAEDLSDLAHCLEDHSVSVVERLKRVGVLGPKTICAHCVHINEREMEILAETGTKVVHNPQSNLNNAVGIADLIGMLKKGVCVGLGTDAMTLDMLQELRSALWAQKYRTQNPSAGMPEVIRGLFLNNAQIANTYWPGFGLGELREGGVADLILVDYDPPTPLHEDSLMGHLCFGIAGASVDTTIASGKVLMKNKVLTELDEKRIMARARELAGKLWTRL